jgi:hypothetical protein
MSAKKKMADNQTAPNKIRTPVTCYVVRRKKKVGEEGRGIFTFDNSLLFFHSTTLGLSAFGWIDCCEV